MIHNRITVGALAVLAGVALSTRAYAGPSPAAITSCQQTIQKVVPKTVSSSVKVIGGCLKGISKGKIPPTTNCNTEFLAEVGNPGIPTAAYGGKAGKLGTNFINKLTKKCDGDDKTPNTADDVTQNDLPPIASLHRGYAGWELDHEDVVMRTGNFTFFESLVEEDCLNLSFINNPLIWDAQGGLFRLLSLLECMTFDEAKAQAEEIDYISQPDNTLSVAKLRLVKPNITYDAGADLQAPVGINDSINIPSATGCQKPGIGACAANPTITCSLTPGSGLDPACAPGPTCSAAGGGGCPAFPGCGGCPLCVEALTGPDGVTGADVPQGSMGFGKAIVKVVDDPTLGTPYADSAEIKCWAEQVLDNTLTPVSTTLTGNCSGGPNNTLACNSFGDCANNINEVPSHYACLSGDEYHCQVDLLAGSNPDNSPACAGPCLAALAPGAPLNACGVGGGALCVIGTCAGGARNGQECDITGVTTCPGGACTAGAPVVLTGDEVGFFAPAFGGMAYLLCPVKARIDLPMEIHLGAGLAVEDVVKDPLSLCLPTGKTNVQVEGAYIHEKGASTTSLIQFYTNGGVGGGGSADKIPCANVALPLPASNTGLPTSSGIGPIIGVTGVGN